MFQRVHFEEDLRFMVWREKPEVIEFQHVSRVKRYYCEEVEFDE